MPVHYPSRSLVILQKTKPNQVIATIPTSTTINNFILLLSDLAHSPSILHQRRECSTSFPDDCWSSRLLLIDAIATDLHQKTQVHPWFLYLNSNSCQLWLRRALNHTPSPRLLGETDLHYCKSTTPKSIPRHTFTASARF